MVAEVRNRFIKKFDVNILNNEAFISSLAKLSWFEYEIIKLKCKHTLVECERLTKVSKSAIQYQENKALKKLKKYYDNRI